MSRVKFSPDEDRIIVLKDAEKEQTESGILIPVASRAMYSGTVMRVGPASKKKEGDRVMYGKYSGVDITIDGVDYKLMRDPDVFGNI